MQVRQIQGCSLYKRTKDGTIVFLDVIYRLTLGTNEESQEQVWGNVRGNRV